jgi:hypothetical protein
MLEFLLQKAKKKKWCLLGLRVCEYKAKIKGCGELTEAR